MASAWGLSWGVSWGNSWKTTTGGAGCSWANTWANSWNESWCRGVVTPPSAGRYPGPAGAVTGAGRKRRRTLVEIDGETFVVRSADEARALLTQAREQAEAVASRVAKTALNKARDVERKTGTLPVLEVAVPEIKVLDGTDEIASMVIEAQRGVDEIYLKAAQAVELAYLARRAYYEQDEDDAIAMILLH